MNHGDTEVLAESHVGVGGIATPAFVRVFDIAHGFDEFDTGGLAEAEFVVIIIVKFFATLLSDFGGAATEQAQGLDRAGV